MRRRIKFLIPFLLEADRPATASYLVRLCDVFTAQLSSLGSDTRNLLHSSQSASVPLRYLFHCLIAAVLCPSCKKSTLYVCLRMYVYIHTVRQELAFLRPPDIVVGGLRFYCDSSSSFFFYSSAILRARWTKLNQNRTHARKWVRFENVLRSESFGSRGIK